ncbi:MAG: DUF6503 family protein [Robiginitalea sp.]
MRFAIAILLSLALGACRETPAPSVPEKEVVVTTSPTAVNSRFPEAFEKSLAAHGGLEQFKQFKSLEYTLENWPFSQKGPLTDLQRVDLKNRKVLIEGTDYRLGYNGDEVWVENPKALGTPAEFYYATPYYFSLVPFVFADPGTRFEDLGIAELGNQQYHSIKVTYESGTGDTPEDYYILYLDPESYTVRVMTYIVSFPAFRQGKAVSELEPHVIVYKDFQEVEGLKMPHEFEFYNWNEETEDLMEGARGGAVFSEMKLLKTAFPAMIFNKTE